MKIIEKHFAISPEELFVPSLSSIHIRPPPAPQQNDFSRRCSISEGARPVSAPSMQVNLCRWRSSDIKFSYLNYLGRRRPNYSLREFIPSLNSLAKNILAMPILFFDEINYNRKAKGLQPISKSSFFKVLNDVGFSEVAKKHICRIGYYKNLEFQTEKLAANRKALSNLFTLQGLLNEKNIVFSRKYIQRWPF